MAALPTHMTAVLLTGHGGLDRLVVRDDVPVPTPVPGDVLIRVGAAGVNNTDVNTRIGWYAKDESDSDVVAGGWAGAIDFPRIQGADCCGVVVAVGEGVPADRVGERVLVRAMFRVDDDRFGRIETLGSERDGAFAQFVTVPAKDALRVESRWSDVELASLPCAYSTAENLLTRAAVSAGERVVVTGASGGVGVAAVQLARVRGAEVTAVAAADKADALLALGASTVVERGTPLDPDSADAIVDVVGGPAWTGLLAALRPGGRCAIAGAIAGPLATIDLRDLYLRDLTVIGCTRQDDAILERLVDLVESDAIRPVVAKTYPLEEIAAAQQDFTAKRFVGKLVLVPPQ